MRFDRRFAVAGLAVLVACDEVRDVADLPTSGTPIEDCPDEGWCWVRGRPIYVSGDPSNDVVHALGAEGAFLLWEDDHWIDISVPTRATLYEAWIGQEDDIWVRDEEGNAWHFDGTGWIERSGGVRILQFIRGPDSGLWARGGTGLVRWTGNAWVAPIPEYPYCRGESHYLVVEDEFWSAGFICDAGDETVDAIEVRRWDGQAWVLVGERVMPSLDRGVLRLLAREGRVYVSMTEEYFEWDGETWRQSAAPELPPSGGPIPPEELDCPYVYRAADERTWCHGEGQIYFETDGEWVPTLADPFAETSVPSRWGTIPPILWAGGGAELAWGSGPNDVYRASRRTGRMLEHYDGLTWSIVLEEEVLDLQGRAAEVWVTTARGLFQFDGTEFTHVSIPAELSAGAPLEIHIVAEGLIVLTGDALLLYDGTWSVLHRAEEPSFFTDVTGASADDLYLIVYTVKVACLEHFDGAEWAPIPGVAVSRWDDLITTDAGDSWHLGPISIRRLGSSELPIPSWDGPRDASLWVGGGAAWMLSPDRARRYALSGE